MEVVNQKRLSHSISIKEAARGPGRAPINLRVNGSWYSLEVEPRRTLLDALAQPLQRNGYKVLLVRAIVSQALEELGKVRDGTIWS